MYGKVQFYSKIFAKEGSRMYLSGGKSPGEDADILRKKKINCQYDLFFYDSNVGSALLGFGFLRNMRAYRKRII